MHFLSSSVCVVTAPFEKSSREKSDKAKQMTKDEPGRLCVCSWLLTQVTSTESLLNNKRLMVNNNNIEDNKESLFIIFNKVRNFQMKENKRNWEM